MLRSTRALLLSASLLAAPRVDAQELNYQTYLIGTRAMGMGGAFTGVADDPSAAFHNPAGLGPIERSSTSANLTVIALEGWTLEGGYGTRSGVFDLEHDALPSLPLFVGFVQKFGDRDADGVRQHGVALSIVRPALVRRTFRVDDIEPARSLANTLHIQHQDSAQWYGVSYGLRVGHGLSLGIGTWLALRDLRHREEEFVAEGIAPIDGRRTADRFFARYSEAAVDSIDLVLRFGLLWQVDAQWRLGLMFQPGPISLSTTAAISSRLGVASGEMLTDVRFVELTDLPGQFPMPWQVRLGVSHAFTPLFRMALDVSVYAPMGSAAPIRTFGPTVIDPVSGEPVRPGRFLPAEWHANATANVSVGIDALIADVVPLSAGVFTDLSAAPSIDGPSAEYRPAQIHGFGASLAAGWRRGDFDVQIGVAGVVGWGTGLGTNPDPDPLPGERYLPRDARRHTLYFFISGTERAAATLVREILTEMGITDEAEGQGEVAAEQDEVREGDGAADVSEDETDLAADDPDDETELRADEPEEDARQARRGGRDRRP